MTANEDACPHRSNLRALADVDPYPTYAAAAAEAPVHWDESLRGWVVFGFKDADAVLMDDPTFVMPWTLLEGGHEALGRYGIFNLTGDAQAEAHRELLDFFNPQRNKTLKPTVERLVAESFARIRGAGEVDFVNEIARRVPGLMGLAFLGVPQDDETLETVHHANLALQVYMQGFGDDPAALDALRSAHRELGDLWAPTIAARRREPADDIISRLVRQERELPDWSDTELMSQCLFFFGASFGNTANSIANAAYVLATDEALREGLRADPDKVSVFVDEVLRVWGAVQFRIRIATRDTEIAGQPIAHGDRVIIVVGAANRDERKFAHADQIDIDRSGGRRHLTFGKGARYCVGAPLARLETTEIVQTLLAPESGQLLLTAPDVEAGARFVGLNYRVWEPVTLCLTPAPSSMARAR